MEYKRQYLINVNRMNKIRMKCPENGKIFYNIILSLKILDFILFFMSIFHTFFIDYFKSGPLSSGIIPNSQVSIDR